MKNKPRLLIRRGRWTVDHHKVDTRTNYPFPYTAAYNWVDTHNLKEGR